MSKPSFISEEEFAAMVKGMNTRAKGGANALAVANASKSRKVINPSPSSTMQSFFVPGILPGQNVILGRATRWLYRKEKKIWEAKALLAIRDARLSPMGRVHITWGWIERNKRRDPDNFTGLSKKFILDAMVKSGVIPDDGWSEVAGWTDVWHVEADNPGVLVTLEGTS